MLPVKGQEFSDARRRLGLSKDQMALELGYRGSRRNNIALMMRYENDSKQIPLTVASLAWLLVGYFELTGQIPEWPDWPGYDPIPDPPQLGDEPEPTEESLP